jgi:hypothetical protein
MVACITRAFHRGGFDAGDSRGVAGGGKSAFGGVSGGASDVGRVGSRLSGLAGEGACARERGSGDNPNGSKLRTGTVSATELETPTPP